ncbi:MAG: hypothetical protein AVDCRST_MAG68-3359 [uncultured Gemmatimonadetes bacterium]|uniref:N-acetyltransferase domain-containing protein n=1 Tax=uncultured Gemmatimonadota bacterium TaxID=203437 RepID=A0A6J4LKC2_9BACT|nr:MAG: hypothetical protein AVDCRST_MAG68-3359 [uncultured Gemmatimonadota bacterium]
MEDGSDVEGQPVIYHDASFRACRGYVDLDGLYSAVPVRHAFTLTLPLDDTQYADAHGSLPNALGSAIEVREVPEEGWTGREVVLARLSMAQLNSQHRGVLRTSWHEWLDSIDGDLEWVGSFLDSAADDTDQYECDLIGGALFHIYNVAVHPAVRGQDVGLRLIAHALLTTSSGLNDAVTLIAADSPDEWDGRARDQTSVRAAALARHYARLGFSEVDRRDDGANILMYAPIGRCGLRVEAALRT